MLSGELVTSSVMQPATAAPQHCCNNTVPRKTPLSVQPHGTPAITYHVPNHAFYGKNKTATHIPTTKKSLKRCSTAQHTSIRFGSGTNR